MSMKRLAIAFALSVAVPSGALAASSSGGSGRPRLQKELQRLVSAGSPGAIPLVRVGVRELRLASGYGDVAQRTAMRSGDRFRIASLTKSYVATVLLQLVGERKLALDDSVDRRLPGVVPNGAHITIRQLLNHTSGLFDYENDARVLAPYFSGDFGYRWTPRQLVDIAVAYPPLFAPGQRYSYSNTNYMIIGLIIEKVTGRSLGVELTRRIFRPLELRSTSFPTTARINGPHAHGYYVLGQPPAADVTGLTPFPWAAGAIVSTAPDVATFYRALLSGRLLRPRLLREMEKTIPEGSQVDIPGQRAGLGLQRFPTACGAAWGTTGRSPDTWCTRSPARTVAARPCSCSTRTPVHCQSVLRPSSSGFSHALTASRPTGRHELRNQCLRSSPAEVQPLRSASRRCARRGRAGRLAQRPPLVGLR
jgi:D-alanyl-D-alanine carboxypeptidase